MKKENTLKRLERLTAEKAENKGWPLFSKWVKREYTLSPKEEETLTRLLRFIKKC